MSRGQYKQFNCYLALGIMAGASPNEVRKAWIVASKKHHPDMGGSDAAQAKVNLAYEVLSDPVARQAHDIYWNTNVGRPTVKPRPQDTGKASKQEKNEPLYKFKERLYETIEKEKAEIWRDLGNRTNLKENAFKEKFHQTRQTIFWTTFASIGSAFFAPAYPLLWFVTAGLALASITNLQGANIGGRKFSIFAADIEKGLKQHAHHVASENCKNDAEKLDRYIVNFASLVELLNRPSSFDDSEEQVARRLTACLFLMGYMPTSFDSSDRTLLFRDNEEKILVRFRHREGNAVNVSYVQKLATLMKSNNASHGLIFCSPGLSGNAAAYADRNNIRYYSLASMNDWIKETLVSEYHGPPESVLSGLDKLSVFLQAISPQVSYRGYGQRKRRSRYRR